MSDIIHSTSNPKILTLKTLREEKGIKKIDLSNSQLSDGEFEGIFESYILPHADELEFLNLGGNNLSRLPPSFCRCKALKILFFANNNFESVPEALSNIELNMLSFKGNRLTDIAEGSLNPSISWLILTDNQLTRLPRTIGNLVGLRKVMLAANKISYLPDEMKRCRDIELIRLSSNAFTEFPDWLWTLPRLSWVAFAGNIGNAEEEEEEEEKNRNVISYNELEVKEKLGEGASGEVFRVVQGDTSFALKLFRGAATSDGLPEDEIRVMRRLGSHDNLVNVLASVAGLPGGQEAALMPLLPPSFAVLGQPPNFQTCTRDTYPDGKSFTPKVAVQILEAIAGACAHLHSRGLSHGDLYAHNILLEGTEAGECTRVKLTDYGAASFSNVLKPDQVHLLERVEVRAYGCLIEELLARLVGHDKEVEARLHQVMARAMAEDVVSRPSFQELHQEMLTLLKDVDL